MKQEVHKLGPASEGKTDIRFCRVRPREEADYVAQSSYHDIRNYKKEYLVLNLIGFGTDKSKIDTRDANANRRKQKTFGVYHLRNRASHSLSPPVAQDSSLPVASQTLAFRHKGYRLRRIPYDIEGRHHTALRYDQRRSE